MLSLSDTKVVVNAVLALVLVLYVANPYVVKPEWLVMAHKNGVYMLVALMCAYLVATHYDLLTAVLLVCGVMFMSFDLKISQV